MSKQTDKLLYDVLISEHLVDKTKLDDILKNDNIRGASLILRLDSSSVAGEAKILESLAKKMALEYRQIKNEIVDPNVINRVPIKFAWHYQFMPLTVQDNVLTIAIYYPLDIKTQDECQINVS